MAEVAFTLTARPALAGADIQIGGNRIRLRDDLALVSVALPSTGEEAVAAALKTLGLGMPEATRSTSGGDFRAIRMSPDQILVLSAHRSRDPKVVIRDAFVGAGYTTDQSDAWVTLDLSGPDLWAALERLCPLDLARESFPVGASARTLMAHLGVLILRLDEHRVLLASASSSAASFLHAVETSFRNVQP